MDILQKHKEVVNKANIYYHKFLTKYKKQERNIYIFCEGNEDLGYYGQAIKQLYPQIEVIKFFAEGKSNVLSIHSFIDWSIYNKNQILFFVDRDVSYWLKEPQDLDDNIYITDEYSFENYAVNEKVCINFLEDLYGFASASFDEINNIKLFYEEKWKTFYDNSKFIMASIIVSLERNHVHLAKVIEHKKIIRIANRQVWIEKIEDELAEQYILRKLNLNSEDLSDIRYYMNEFKEHEEYYSIRGKWALTFLVKFMEYIMDNGRNFAPSLYSGRIKEPKRLCQITPENAMAILAPRIPLVDSLKNFLINNMDKYLTLS